MSIAKDIFHAVTDDNRARYEANRTIMSFTEYLDEVEAHPERHLRNAAGYLVDVVDHFGSTTINLPTGSRTRYNLFDADFRHGVGRVVGQERVQERLVRMLKNFVRSGKIDRLLLLHGPNGSAKTSLVQALSAACQCF